MPLAVTVDGADEVDPQLDLIKGYGRAMVREKIVAAASRRLVILVGKEKRVPALGSRGKRPIEVVPYGLALCLTRLQEIGLAPTPYRTEGKLYLSDNSNHIIDCHTNAITDPENLEKTLRAIPGVVGTGLFLEMASVVLVGDEDRDFALVEEKHRGPGANGA